MAQIEVIRDPNITQSEIVHALRDPSNEGYPDAEVQTVSENQQTQIFGILVPLLALNGVAIDWSDVLLFNLDDTHHIPTCQFRFQDRMNIFSKYSHAGNDNEFRVQILPPFDDTYKKIDLTFLITDIHIADGIVEGEAIYNLPALTEYRFKALGSINTYDLLDQISLETGLGLASNVQSTEDTRFIQCSFESYKDVLTREMEKSGSSESQVFDWWVDCWNNLILCDLYDRINSVDTEEDMMVWATTETQSGSVNLKPEPVQIPALFTNHPVMERTDFYVPDYNIQNNPITASRGNTLAVSIYEENKKEALEHYIADGDIAKNEFIKFEYLGEVYGDYNYFIAQKCREVYLAKVKSEVVVLHLNRPQLGVMRGSQCRFVWYDNNSVYADNEKILEDSGTIASVEELSTQIGWLRDWVLENQTKGEGLKVNLQYSGQYTSIGQYITYDGNSQRWDSWLYLVRPTSKRPIISQQENI